MSKLQRRPVYPVRPASEPSRAVAQPAFRETPPVVSDAILRRHGGRILDPAVAAQPSASRRERLNRGKRDPKALIEYRPTAYVGTQLLVEEPVVDELIHLTHADNSDHKLSPGELKVSLVPDRRDRERAR